MQSLLDAIYANPDDDAARAVYADSLITQDDPRGEFIVIQLQGKRGSGKRARELLAKHRAEWLGPLASVVQKQNQQWERGFLSRASVSVRNAADLRALTGHPMWSTVKQLSLGGLRSILHPVMRSLEHIDGVHMQDVDALCANRWPRLKYLEIVRPEQYRPAIERFDGAPALETFKLGGTYFQWPDLDGLFAAPFMRTVKHLIVPAGVERLGEWVRNPRVDHVELRPIEYAGIRSTLRIDIDRVSQDRVRLTAHVPPDEDDSFPEVIVAQLIGTPPALIEEIVMERAGLELVTALETMGIRVRIA